MDIELIFGSWLRQRRNELGVSQEQFSEHLDISYSTLRKLESGERRPSGQIAYLLADYFSVPADEREAFVAYARTGRAASIPMDPASGGRVQIAPWRKIYSNQTNLPVVLTPLIGREQEEGEAHAHLLNPKTRLLTLTGTPGIGKTRLALQVASGLVEHFVDGTFFVDLAPVADPDLVLPTIAKILDLDAGDQPIERVLLDYLRERRMLLLLDNFEQVLDAGPAVVKLMEASPWLKVLVTSREALHIRGERRLPVPLLGLPDPYQTPHIETLLTYPSVELFVEHAHAAHPDFTFTNENAADVAAVCIGLEGLPLAIELAAARSRHFSPAEIRSALGSRLQLLTGGARDLPPRHRTLRGAIEWSYDLLDQNEQHFFQHLGVFAGGFTLEALSAIFAGLPGASVTALELLVSLTDKHLVSEGRQPTKPEGTFSAARFRMLEAVREYAVEQMEQYAQLDEIRRRHSDYYLSLAERADHHFTGTQHPGWGEEQIRWINTLETELGNIRVALDWYHAQTESETVVSTLDNLQKGLRLTTALRRVWIGRDHAGEGLQWLTAFLSKVPKPLPANLRELRLVYARAQLMVGRLTTASGATLSTPVLPLLVESLSIFTELEDKQYVALTLLILGVVAQAQGDYAAARSHGTECLKLYRELENKWGSALVLQDLGSIAFIEDDLTLSRSLFEESLALSREIGDSFNTASALERLGHMAYFRREYTTAHSLWLESLQHNRVGPRSGAGHILVLLGWAALRKGSYDEARALFKEGLLLAKGMLVAREWDALVTIYRGLVGLGTLDGTLQTAERAAFFMGAAETLAARRFPMPPVWQAELESEIQTAYAQLHGETWDKAWAEGSTSTVEEAIVFATGDEPHKVHITKAVPARR